MNCAFERQKVVLVLWNQSLALNIRIQWTEQKVYSIVKVCTINKGVGKFRVMIKPFFPSPTATALSPKSEENVTDGRKEDNWEKIEGQRVIDVFLRKGPCCWSENL